MAAVTLLASACGPAPPGNTEAYKPPPPLALVVLVDPSSDRIGAELRQLQEVVRTGATPGEAIVVMVLQPSYGQAYQVRPGDNLSSIAASHGMTLAALEAANPQLGPLSGRDWKLIHPNERVIIPDGATQNSLLLVSRAPAGPPVPQLIRLPQLPGDATDYQRAQYKHTVASDTATNDARIAAWQAEAARDIAPWQQSVVDQLGKLAAAPVIGARAPNTQMVSASMLAGLTTLNGLDGRRTLVLLGGGEHVPAALQPRCLANVDLVVANLSDTGAAAAWSSAGMGAGAESVEALDPALTQLQLARVINH
jgi:LysM domain